MGGQGIEQARQNARWLLRQMAAATTSEAHYAYKDLIVLEFVRAAELRDEIEGLRDGGLTPPAPLSLDPVNDTGSGGTRGEDGEGTWTAILDLKVCGEHELHVMQSIVTADFGEHVVEGFLTEPPQWIILKLDGTRYRISMAALVTQAIGELMLRRDEGLA